jgi:hypothetical protein
VIRKKSSVHVCIPVHVALAVIGLTGVLGSRGLAAESFSQISHFYSNSLTNECAVLEDFARFGGGYGSFEVNPQFGLELTSDVPDVYTGIRVLKTLLSASHSWQVIVKAHVDLSAGASNQENPYYSCGLGIAKVARNCDLSTSLLKSAPNRWEIGFVNESSVGSYRRELAIETVDETAPIQLPPAGSKEVYLRLRYSADEKLLSAAYSIDGTDFFSLPLGGEDFNAAQGWDLAADDHLAVFLTSGSEPYGFNDDNDDWWSAYDQSPPAAPLRPDPVYSVPSGEMFLRDLSIGYVPSPASSFEWRDLGSAIEITSISYAVGISSSPVHLSVPYLIDGKPVTSIASGAFYGGTNISSVVLPASVTSVGSEAFAFCAELKSVSFGPTVTSIGANAFLHTDKLANVSLALPFILKGEVLGLQSQVAFQALVQSVGASLAENELFMASLASSEKFLGLLTAKLLSRFQSYGLATRPDLANLATKDDLQTTAVQSKAEGVNSVLADPNAWSLYTANQIQNMAIGDLLLQKGGNGNFTLYYDIEQSNDLKNWTVYQSYGETISGLPTNKAFLRIRAKK